MIYQSIADIYAANDTVRRQLAARVETLSDAQQTFRPAPDAWSIAEIMEHLSIIEQSMVRLIGMLLNKAESAPAGSSSAQASHDAHAADANNNNATVARPFKPFSLDAYVDAIKDKKLDAPEQVRPGGQVALADSLANLQRSRAAVEGFRPRLEAADLSVATYPHPAFGELDAAQWLAFIGHHEGRHLRQIERLMEAPEFAGKNGS
ncbi:MAG TPA: DinB family protein [Pyrinomonadaceae bacterium]|nr:DinB family protein [Pyrinomonadaceae bacterium]